MNHYWYFPGENLVRRFARFVLGLRFGYRFWHNGLRCGAWFGMKKIHNKGSDLVSDADISARDDSPFETSIMEKRSGNIGGQTKIVFAGFCFPRSATLVYRSTPNPVFLCYAIRTKSGLTFGARIEVVFRFQRRSFSGALFTRDEPCKLSECRTRQVATTNPSTQN